MGRPKVRRFKRRRSGATIAPAPLAVAVRAPLWLLLASGLASVASGEDTANDPSFPGPPFVDTSIPAVPGAVEVLQDIPNALYWARQQRGQLGGWTYVLFPDGTAEISEGDERPRIVARLTCRSGQSCQVSRADGTSFEVPAGRGTLPALPEVPDLENVVRYLAGWMLSGTVPPSAPGQMPEQSQRDQSAATALPSLPNLAADQAPAGRAPMAPSLSSTPKDEAPKSEVRATPREAQVATAPTSASPPAAPTACAQADPYIPDACAQPASQRPVQSAAPARTSSVVSQTPPETEEKVSFVDRYKVSCSVTGSISLGALTSDAEARGTTKPRVSLGCGAQLTERLSMRLALIRYLKPGQQETWDPDYTYAFTYRINDKFSLGYSNYSTRFTGGDSPVAGLFDGKVRVSYKLPPVPLWADKTLPCTASVGLPDPSRQSLNLSCGYAVTPKLRVGATAYLYAPGEQGTYQPDYSYTASYRISDDWLVSYQNYSNNRWPWNRGEAAGPGFTGGGLSLTYQISF